MVKTKEVEDKVRDLINWVQVMTLEELKIGEGKKIEEDTAKILKKKLQEIARLVANLECQLK